MYLIIPIPPSSIFLSGRLGNKKNFNSSSQNAKKYEAQKKGE